MASGAALSLAYTPEFPCYSHTASHKATVLLSLTAAAQAAEAQRPAVSVSAVLDNSGSMAGRKLQLVKNTTAFLVTQLTDRDALGVVSFDTEVREVADMQHMTSDKKDKTTAAVDAIQAGSCTNLSGGLFKGVSQQQAWKASPDSTATPTSVSQASDWEVIDSQPGTEPQGLVRSVLLFTDGLANVGLTATSQLVTTLQRMLDHPVKTTVYTFGFGADHDPQMLEALAEAGCGHYYYIDSEDKIPTAFADALGGLMSVCAQNVELELIPQAGVTLTELKTSYTQRRLPGGGISVTVGDLYSEERKDFLLDLELGQLEQRNQELVEMRVTYFDIQTGSMGRASTTIAVQRGVVNPDLPPAADVLAHRARFEAAHALRQAIKLAEEGQLESARTLLDMEVTKCKVLKRTVGDHNLTTALENDIRNTMAGFSTQAQYRAVGSKAARSSAACHSSQRSAAVHEGSAAAALYSTTNQTAMRAQSAQAVLGDSHERRDAEIVQPRTQGMLPNTDNQHQSQQQRRGRGWGIGSALAALHLEPNIWAQRKTGEGPRASAPREE